MTLGLEDVITVLGYVRPLGVEQRMREMEYAAYKKGIADAFNRY